MARRITGVDTANHIGAVASRRNEVLDSLLGVQMPFKTPSRQSAEFQINCETAFSVRNLQKEILRSRTFSHNIDKFHHSLVCFSFGGIEGELARLERC